MDRFDSIIIGSGQAGGPLALALAGRGERVALVEGDRLGGTCVNTGCTPTKTLRKTARVAHLARRAADFGVHTGPVEVDFSAAMARMRERVEASRDGLAKALGAARGLELVRGWGRLDGRDGDRFAVRVGERRLTARRIYLNTGARPSLPPLAGLGDVAHLDHAGLLALKDRPGHLLIVGGSAIGLEMGQMFRRLGSRVTLVHRADRLAEREDEDVSTAIADVMLDEGVGLVLEADVRAAAADARGSVLSLGDGREIVGTHLLFATGRAPDTGRLGLETVGVETDERGTIRTDPRLNTSVPGIKALGDVNGRGAFTHTSYHDHEIVLAELDGLEGLHQWAGADLRPSTYAIYTDPPLGRVGLSLADAKREAASGRRLLAASMPMAEVSRAKEEGETAGLIRIIVDERSERIVGATVFGIGGDEVVAVLSNFMATGSRYPVMRQALPIHPTVAELLPTVLGRLEPVRP